jgi:hypothetical protein
MGTRVVTVNDVLEGHVALDIQCLDRIYLNAYVPKLQSSATTTADGRCRLPPTVCPALVSRSGGDLPERGQLGGDLCWGVAV